MTVLQQWATSQANPEIVVNRNFIAVEHTAVYGKDATTTTGLTWGYLSGRWGGFAVTAGTLTLTASNTNYIVVARATGVISVSTASTNWDNTTEYARVYKLTVGVSTVTTEEDHRTGDGGIIGTSSGGGGGGALNDLSDVDTTGVSDGDVLTYDSGTSTWIASAPAGGGGGITFGTSQTTTTGTSKDFSIPAGVKRVRIKLSGVSRDAATYIMVQLGTSSTPATSGYATCSSNMAATTVNTIIPTDGFRINLLGATSSISGVLDIERFESGSNKWTAFGIFNKHDAAETCTVSGQITLGGELDILRITSSSGAGNFDLGSANISYE